MRVPSRIFSAFFQPVSLSVGRPFLRCRASDITRPSDAPSSSGRTSDGPSKASKPLPLAQQPTTTLKLEDLATPEQLKQAEAYIDVMLEVNKVMNLTGITDKDEAMQRHVHDCLALLPIIDQFVPGSATQKLRVVDVGSGAGLPGVILAVARPQWEVYCLDALRKRCDFVGRAVEQCGISNCRPLWARAEEAGQNPEHRETFDLVVARAVADMRELSEYCIPFAKVGGYWVAAKGAECDEEVRGARKAIDTLGGRLVTVAPVESFSPVGQRTAVVVEKVKACSAKYPRRPGTPKAKPL